MEWTILPPVEWWVLFRGALLSFSCVVVAYSVVWVVLNLTDRSEGLTADPVQLAEKRRALGEIGREAFEGIRRDGGTPSPHRVGP
jgi:hypothetical protein